MQKITPFLWFDSNAEEAVQFYLSVFKDGKIHSTARYPDVENPPGKPGTVMTIAFEMNGQQFVALNGGSGFPFTNAVSLVVNCESQEEIDHFWEKLAADGGGEALLVAWPQIRHEEFELDVLPVIEVSCHESHSVFSVLRPRRPRADDPEWND